MTLPSNLSGWNRSIVSLNLSLRSFFSISSEIFGPAVELGPGRTKTEMASGVKWSTDNRKCVRFEFRELCASYTGQGISWNPSKCFLPAINSFHLFSYSSLASSHRRLSFSSFLFLRSSSIALSRRRDSALRTFSRARRSAFLASLRSCSACSSACFFLNYKM